MDHRLLGGIAAVVAILTLPLGLLAGLFVGFEAAAVVFVVGWFLLTPLIPIVGNEIWPAIRERSGRADESADADDPLEELKARYARGEIGDAEFERRMERLVEVEDVEVGTSADRADRELSMEREPSTERE